ncbi:MAG: hypothetical protein ACJ8FZ_26340 [Bradyrhizobium sp.]
MIAVRRSAARSARLATGLRDGFEEAGPADLPTSARRLAGFRAAFLAFLLLAFVMLHNMTDWSVIVNFD